MSFDHLFQLDKEIETEEINVQLTEGVTRFANNVLLESELIALADLRYNKWKKDDFNLKKNVQEKQIMISLERFELALHCSILINGAWSGWAWRISTKGANKLDCLKPLWYGCRCEHSIKLRCVCTERTYCPNPEHSGNGCHGSHD